MNRRQFLSAGASLAAFGGIYATGGYLSLPDSNSTNTLLVSAAQHKNGEHYVIAVSPTGDVISQTLLPKRAHDTLALVNKKNHVLVFARRPDTFALEINVLTGNVTHSFTSEEGRHFYGHGALSGDGHLLFTTENDYKSGRGIIVVRDTQNYQVIGEMDSGGVGPHQLKVMPNGKQLVVANGGILTHPDWPRMKLNIDTMAPNLAYIDIQSGAVINTFTPPNHQQSIRHIDVNEHGIVIAGIQFQGDKRNQLPLIYIHNGEDALQPMQAPEAVWHSMRQYTASVIVNGNEAYVSCPKGDMITHWSIDTKTLLAKKTLNDVAGIAQGAGLSRGPTFSSGLGKLVSLAPNTEIKVSQFKFDNHMISLSLYS
jgi:hypothetical protein